LLSIDGNNNTLRAKAFCRFFNQLRLLYSSRIDAYFISTGCQHAPDIFKAPDTTAYGKRYKYLGRDRFDYVHHRIPIIAASGNIQKGNLIGALLIVAVGDFYRVASITNIDKADPLNYTAIGHVKTGNNAFG
jgi:hypothetical protein